MHISTYDSELQYMLHTRCVFVYVHYHCFLFILVPKPTIGLSVLDNQTVGQSLTLECTIFTVRGVNSNVDIRWRIDSLLVKSSENISVNTSSNNAMIYIETYTISQLSTADEGKTYQCDVLINAMSPITTYDNITLDVTGKGHKQNNVCNIKAAYMFSSLCQYYHVAT